MCGSRTLSVGYHPDAKNEKEDLFGRYPWIPELWDRTNAEIARRIRGPRECQVSDPLYFGIPGEDTVYHHRDQTTSQQQGAYFVLMRIEGRFAQAMRNLLQNLPWLTTMWDTLSQLIVLNDHANPRRDPGDQDPAREELWKATISFRDYQTQSDIEACVSYGVHRQPDSVFVRILMIEEVPPEERQFQNIWKNGGA